jgi:hypothetical protein
VHPGPWSRRQAASKVFVVGTEMFRSGVDLTYQSASA